MRRLLHTTLSALLAVAAATGIAATARAADATGPITGLAGKCVDVAASATANGTPVQLYTCNGTAAQQWTVVADRTVRAFGKCLDVQGGINADGTKVQLWDCNGNPQQQWTYDPARLTLVNPATGRCLDARGQSDADRTPLQVWTCNGQTNQRWTLPTGQGCQRAVPVGEHAVPVVLGGTRYDVTVYVPASAPATAPLVLNLHGTGSWGANQLYYSDMKVAADANGFLVAAPSGAMPNGDGYAWNVPGVGSYPPGSRDDVAFLDQVITTLTGSLCGDPKRVYATGYSGGGRMTSAYACARPDRVAAIAPVAGLRAGRPDPADASRPDTASCRPSVSVPVVAFHGRQDATNPYDGGGSDVWRYSVPAAQQRWAAINGCTGSPTSTTVSTHVTSTAYRCGADVVLYTVSDGGHTWPGTPRPSPGNGSTTQEINANTLMWQFFTRYTR
ncbi:extracellular catalytic domain type 1 short-chain-length polyhydroxyalkanoate depolymerase [Actinophytocola oryzae]|uniref:Polyhydroxybutyrate depolymerase n=1 Tax=Actinophytocola oryzae TaxID=502181 RepID=A0A4R7VHQ6_9PSEU|nr:ricin-type beta-trefoil lectin domain protein [Actinophytocola oryzae]TDV48880.1 polyhydroxybutyrate depolymerase [Actinophytocola oryzae]